jgi:hypothetical protein
MMKSQDIAEDAIVESDMRDDHDGTDSTGGDDKIEEQHTVLGTKTIVSEVEKYAEADTVNQNAHQLSGFWSSGE